ncbi:MAG: bile acid:sodium symporter family protein [Planctomycetota bacterium]|jgi:sodium/bile acid cotransporter 7
MLAVLRKRWFLISLLILIPSGLLTGYFGNVATVESARGLVNTRLLTAFILTLMAFSLNSSQLKASLQKPGPVCWASLCNYALIPLLGWAGMSLQLTSDFRIGLMIAASTPCTLAAASVWTRKAGGNDAVSLLTTLLTNTMCFVVTPFWLVTATGQAVDLDMNDLTQRLVMVVLVPTLLGQALRTIRPAADFATRFKTPIGVVAQSCVLLLVLLASLGGGIKLRDASLGQQLGGLVVVWTSCIAIHLAAFFVAWQGGGILSFERKDRIAASFAGSQKTLPIGVYLATDPSAFGGADVIDGSPIPFAVFPMLMFHASQLFVDTLIADRIKASETPEPKSSGKELPAKQ